VSLTLQPGWDISHYQYDSGATRQKADWDHLVSAGIKFVFAKALETGSGLGFHPSGFPLGTDPAWPWHKKQLERVHGSIVKGAYCWIHNDGNEATQADTFLGLLDSDHNPNGWLCAIDLEGSDGFASEAPPGYASVARFAKEFWKQAPGHPLFLYTRKTYWNNKWQDKNAKALGLTLWTAAYPLRDAPGVGNCVDGSDLGTINITAFDSSAAKLSFGYTAKSPYCGGYAGFTGPHASTIIQWGGLTVSNVGTADGDAFKGTIAELHAFTRPSEPAGAVTWRPSPVYADAFILQPAAFHNVAGVNWTPDPVFADAFVAQPRMGTKIKPGSAVVTSNAPTATVTGGV
jgi:hypothetical protein